MTQFDETKNGCAVCEAMLPEAVDGTLTAAEQQAFDRHVAGCVHCSRELAEARRGAAWLSMLKSKTPEPPAGLLEKILAETSGVAVATPLIAPRVRDEWATQGSVAAHGWGTQAGGGWSSRWSAARMKLSEVFSFESANAIFQPRLAMTAAMAFFSVAITMNLAGIRLHDLRAANFGPSAVRRTVADAGASATREFVNMRVVYQVESRVSELRNDDQR
jgi:anti-sigma factor RsiW